LTIILFSHSIQRFRGGKSDSSIISCARTSYEIAFDSAAFMFAFP
jgi:hypothetical protein